MHEAGEFFEVLRPAGQFQHVDAAYRMALLQSPTDATVAGEGVIAEVLPDKEPAAFMFAFGDLEFHAGVVGTVSLKTSEPAFGQDAQAVGHNLHCGLGSPGRLLWGEMLSQRALTGIPSRRACK